MPIELPETLYTGPPEVAHYQTVGDSGGNTVVIHGSAYVVSLPHKLMQAWMEMTPEEAEDLARLLLRTAAEAKGRCRG